MTVKLRTEHHLEFLSLKRGCTGSSESTLVKMSYCWKSHTRLTYYCYYQVVAKEPDYMPSFHGGFYVDRLNAKDLMLEQRKEKEVNVSHQNTLVDTGLDKQQA